MSPKLYDMMTPEAYTRELLSLVSSLVALLQQNHTVSWESPPTNSLEDLRREHQINHVFSSLKTSSEFAQKMLNITQNHLVAVCHDIPYASLKVIPTIFSSTETQAKIAKIDHGALSRVNLGWHYYYQDTVTLPSHTLEGDHFSLIVQPGPLARAMEKILTPLFLEAKHSNEDSNSAIRCKMEQLFAEHEKSLTLLTEQFQKRFADQLANQSELFTRLFEAAHTNDTKLPKPPSTSPVNVTTEPSSSPTLSPFSSSSH